MSPDGTSLSRQCAFTSVSSFSYSLLSWSWTWSCACIGIVEGGDADCAFIALMVREWPRISCLAMAASLRAEAYYS